ncbi:hypothetical protein B0H11DRAFT_2225074 [Mycena galericulata]|nr:hypothetical protein B0H11DRAFT_2225074 [Mycena galericulata]
MRADAEAWRDAPTLTQRNAIFKRGGTRYSELWQFIYWDPPKMLPTEAMHDIFEGLGKYYTREVLTIDYAEAKKREDFIPAFSYEFTSFDPEDTTIPGECRPKNEAAEKDVPAIHRLLVSPLREDPETRSTDSASDEEDDGGDTPVQIAEGENAEALAVKLAKKLKTALVFVCWTLNLARSPDLRDPKTGKQIKWEEYLHRISRKELAEFLVEWRMSRPLRSVDSQNRPKTITLHDLRFIQQVIAETDTPAWVHHVPKNYGEAAAGSMKADQMRLLMTIYLPIALVILWAEQTGPDAVKRCSGVQP